MRRLSSINLAEPLHDYGADMAPSFSDQEVERYARHLMLRDVGGAGQQALKKARVLIVGVGGVGAPAALYLAAAGVGRLGLLDFDQVSLSNLQRQVLFTEDDIGHDKAPAAAERLGRLNSDIELMPIHRRIDENNAADILGAWDMVIDGSDNLATRLAVSDACVTQDKSLVSAAVGPWVLQVGLFRSRPCWRCLNPEPDPEAFACASQGVLGALTGVAGALAAAAAVKALAEAGEDRAGCLLMLDLLSWRTVPVTVSARPDCPACGPSRKAKGSPS